MSRTTIELDDALVSEVMRRYGMKTKKDAVHFAMRRLVARPLTGSFLLDLEGIGWGGDLDEMRASAADSQAQQS